MTAKDIPLLNLDDMPSLEVESEEPPFIYLTCKGCRLTNEEDSSVMARDDGHIWCNSCNGRTGPTAPPLPAIGTRVDVPVVVRFRRIGKIVGHVDGRLEVELPGGERRVFELGEVEVEP